MEESAERSCDKYWFQLGANYKTFPTGLEKWEVLVRPYERSNSSGTVTASLDEHIKTGALEALVLCELGQHLATNRIRRTTYEQGRSEIQAYIEASRSQFASKTVAVKITSDPMDVARAARRAARKARRKVAARKDAKVKNQNQNPSTNNDAVCWHCGKKGHLKPECWWNPKNQIGRPTQGMSRTTKERWNNESKLQLWRNSRNQLASSVDLVSSEKLGRSPRSDSEG